MLKNFAEKLHQLCRNQINILLLFRIIQIHLEIWKSIKTFPLRLSKFLSSKSSWESLPQGTWPAKYVSLPPPSHCATHNMIWLNVTLLDKADHSRNLGIFERTVTCWSQERRRTTYSINILQNGSLHNKTVIDGYTHSNLQRFEQFESTEIRNDAYLCEYEGKENSTNFAVRMKNARKMEVLGRKLPELSEYFSLVQNCDWVLRSILACRWGIKK